jgi:hypothetical protein
MSHQRIHRKKAKSLEIKVGCVYEGWDMDKSTIEVMPHW